MKVLIVDDDASLLIYTEQLLQKKGLEVMSCADFNEAIEILKHDDINIIITDWVMPGKNGIDLIRWIRNDYQCEHYIYIIVLTAKSLNEDLILAFDEGADDFISKPINPKELFVKIEAGKRVVSLEKKLHARQVELEQANQQISNHYKKIKTEVRSAQKLQKSLLPEPSFSNEFVNINWKYLPAADLAGDLLNYYFLDEEHIGFYLLDVVGHGISASLLSFYLRKTIHAKKYDLLNLKNNSTQPIKKPSQLLNEINQEFCTENDDFLYFTIVYGTLNIKTGEGLLCQAGHPYPLVCRNNNQVDLLGEGGFPIGLSEEASYEDINFKLEYNDTLILYSDGLTECEHFDTNELYGQERLINDCQLFNQESHSQVINTIISNTSEWSGAINSEFTDDISIMSIQRKFYDSTNRI